ncbi:MAG: Hint domain-containing protein [Pseudomonadota bacterium]
MGWLAWSGGHGTANVHPNVTVDSQIDCGALMLEGPLPSELRAMTLLEIGCLHPVPSQLRIQSIPGEGFSVLITVGQQVFHGLISHTLRAQTPTFRLTYNWDHADGSGNLTIEHPGDSAIFCSTLSGCPALPGALVLGAVSEVRALDGSSNVLNCIGFHQGPLAVGPSATLDYHTPILTPQGYRKIGQLHHGDCVVTPSGDIVPILAQLCRTVPAYGSAAPVRLRAPYFGLHSDLVMAGPQRMIVGGSVVEYTFGCDSVLIPAQHLINGTAAIAQPVQDLATYYQLLLPDGQPMIASNVQVESLHVGRIRRRKDVFGRTTLAGLPRHLMPEHSAPTSQILRPFEAITLAAMRAA